MSRIRRALRWLEERTGVGTGLRDLGETPVAGPPSFGRITGWVIAMGIALQVLTGIGLANHYSPGTTSAWGSVFYLEEQVLLGTFLRGLHAFGASAVVICVLLHLLQKAWRLDLGRPLGWWLALCLIPLIAAFSLTGYLLPWDQRGYWATQVASGIMAGTPLVGDWAAAVFRGGDDLGTLTLTRFFSFHAIVLPLSALALGVLAFAAWRRESRLEVESGESIAEKAPEAYFPRHATRDLATFLVVVAAVAVLAGVVGPHLEAPADPEIDFPARPEWYFAPLRELLKVVPEPWGSLVLPGLVFMLLAAMPWLATRKNAKPLVRVAVALPFAAWLGLLILTNVRDVHDDRFQQSRVRASKDATLARELASEGIPPDGPGEMLRLHPPRHGRVLFVTHCQRCHKAGGKGGDDGPTLTGYLSQRWLEGVIREPRHPDYFGNTKIDEMDPMPKEDWGDVPPLAAYVRSLDPSVEGQNADLVAKGKLAYEKHGCVSCHKVTPVPEAEADDLGPNLAGYGSKAWLTAFLENPGGNLFYCEENEMPAYGEELSAREIEALVVYMRLLDEQ